MKRRGGRKNKVKKLWHHEFTKEGHDMQFILKLETSYDPLLVFLIDGLLFILCAVEFISRRDLLMIEFMYLHDPNLPLFLTAT